jgi:hypothetical protein
LNIFGRHGLDSLFAARFVIFCNTFKDMYGKNLSFVFSYFVYLLLIFAALSLMKMQVRSGIGFIDLIDCPPSRWLHLDLYAVLPRYMKP